MIEKSINNNLNDKKKIINHINRLNGQLNGIKKMIEEDRYCGDILIQITAADKSLKSIANNLVTDYLHSYIIKEIQNGNTEELDELMLLFKKMQ